MNLKRQKGDLMNTGRRIDLDTISAADLCALAKAEGMNAEGYLRKLLFDRAARHLKQLKIDRSLFLPKMVECHQCAPLMSVPMPTGKKRKHEPAR